MVLAFIDNTNFYINRSDYRNQIQKAIDEHKKLYEETGRVI